MQEGGRGVRRLLRQAVRFAVPIRWWLLVLFVPPLTVAAGALLYAGLSGAAITFSPSGYLRLAAPAMWVTFLLGPFGEEFGWRGYLLPRLARRFSISISMLIVGVVWAIWHWPLLYQGFIDAPGRELVVVLVGITYMSIWIGTVYLRTESLALAMLMHWNINAARDITATVFLGLPAGTDALLQWSGAIANALVALLAIPLLQPRR
jgi:membrane protease YdiL (CAAX protease family)